MRTAKTFATVTLPFLVALAGCAADTTANSDSEDVQESSVAQPLKSPITKAQCRAFYDAHPHTATVRLRSGKRVGTPFRSCDENLALVYGTVNLAWAQELVAGSGQVPLQILIEGQPPQAAASLFFAHYWDSDAGSYDEFALMIDTVAPDAPVTSFPWTDFTSPLADGQLPTARSFAYQLILPKQEKVAIDYGREILGYDKRGGHIDLDPKGTGMKFDVEDERHDQVVKGKVFDDPVYGFTLPAPIEGPVRIVSLDPTRNGAVTYSTATSWWQPTISPATPESLKLEISKESKLGRLIKNGGFTPFTVVTGEHLQAVFTRD